MNLYKWFNFAVVIFFLATQIGFTSGLLCYHCRKDSEVDTCKDFNIEPYEHSPATDICYRREAKGHNGHLTLSSTSAKSVKVMGCDKSDPKEDHCYCNTDRCNKGDPSWNKASELYVFTPLVLLGLAISFSNSLLLISFAMSFFGLGYAKNVDVRRDGIDINKTLSSLFGDHAPNGHKVVDFLSTNADPKTNWGEYEDGSFKYCPKEMYITHFKTWDTIPQLKNGIMQVAVLCSDRTRNNTLWLESGKAYYENTFQTQKVGCDNGFAIGLDMKAGQEIGGTIFDNDIGMAGFALYCSDDEAQFPRRYPGSISVGSWMSPDKKQICLKGSVLCGIRTQVDDSIKGTGVNNIEMPCCSYDEECTRVEEWKVVFEYNNTNGKENVYDKFTKRLGTSRSKNTNTGVSNSEESGWFIGVKASGSASAEAGVKFKGKAMGQDVKGGAHAEAKGEVEASGGYSNTKKSEYNWEQATSEVFAEETQRESAMVVPAGHATVLKQIVGICGSLVVHTDKFMKIDTDKDGKETVEIIGEGVRFQGQLMAVSISFLLIALWAN